jgi:hypothetical protein
MDQLGKKILAKEVTGPHLREMMMAYLGQEIKSLKVTQI